MVGKRRLLLTDDPCGTLSSPPRSLLTLKLTLMLTLMLPHVRYDDRGPLVAWASDGGLKIMDVDKGKAGERISYVDK